MTNQDHVRKRHNANGVVSTTTNNNNEVEDKNKAVNINDNFRRNVIRTKNRQPTKREKKKSEDKKLISNNVQAVSMMMIFKIYAAIMILTVSIGLSYGMLYYPDKVRGVVSIIFGGNRNGNSSSDNSMMIQFPPRYIATMFPPHISPSKDLPIAYDKYVIITQKNNETKKAWKRMLLERQQLRKVQKNNNNNNNNNNNIIESSTTNYDRLRTTNYQYYSTNSYLASWERMDLLSNPDVKSYCGGDFLSSYYHVKSQHSLSLLLDRIQEDMLFWCLLNSGHNDAYYKWSVYLQTQEYHQLIYGTLYDKNSSTSRSSSNSNSNNNNNIVNINNVPLRGVAFQYIQERKTMEKANNTNQDRMIIERLPRIHSSLLYLPKKNIHEIDTIMTRRVVNWLHLATRIEVPEQEQERQHYSVDHINSNSENITDIISNIRSIIFSSSSSDENGSNGNGNGPDQNYQKAFEEMLYKEITKKQDTQEERYNNEDEEQGGEAMSEKWMIFDVICRSDNTTISEDYQKNLQKNPYFSSKVFIAKECSINQNNNSCCYFYIPPNLKDDDITRIKK